MSESEEYPFTIDNRAWQRFIALADNHFDAATWTREDGRPVMVTLRDLGSGDLITLAVLDSAENNAPHILLAVTGDGTTSAYGPFAGSVTAEAHALPTVLTHPDTTWTVALSLKSPTEKQHQQLTWLPGPSDLTLHAGDLDATEATVILLVVDGDRLAPIGPFHTATDAGSWATGSAYAELGRIILALHAPVVDGFDQPPTT